MKPSKALHAAIMEVVANQLRDGDPPETRQTYDRLLSSGLPEQEIRRLLGCVIVNELFLVHRENKPFNRERFARNLQRFSEMPEGWEEP